MGITQIFVFPIIEKLFQEGKLPQYITLTNETWSVIED